MGFDASALTSGAALGAAALGAAALAGRLLRLGPFAAAPTCDPSVRLKRERHLFCSFLSHEIRTPLQGLQHCLERIRESAAAGGVPDAEDVSGAAACAEHVGRFVSGALEIASLESQGVAVRREPMDLRRALEAARRIAAADGAVVRCALGGGGALALPLEGDECKLTEVVLALLSNAAIHARSDEPIELSAVASGPTPGEPRVALVDVAVRDRGVGIAPGLLGSILRPYACMHPHGSAGGGPSAPRAGLGLPIAARLLEAMNADAVAGNSAAAPEPAMSVESAPGRGTVVTCRFALRVRDPDREASASASASGAAASPTFRQPPPPRRALVVDDNVFNQRALGAYLRAIGVEEVRVASHGGEAIEAVRGGGGEPFGLILMDIQMPVMGGLEAARLLREGGLYAGPIIAVTGNGTPAEVESYLRAGMNDVLVKPVTKAEIAHAYRRYCERGARGGPGRRFSL